MDLRQFPNLNIEGTDPTWISNMIQCSGTLSLIVNTYGWLQTLPVSICNLKGQRCNMLVITSGRLGPRQRSIIMNVTISSHI